METNNDSIILATIHPFNVLLIILTLLLVMKKTMTSYLTLKTSQVQKKII